MDTCWEWRKVFEIMVNPPGIWMLVGSGVTPEG
jgi:hypothetical protein